MRDSPTQSQGTTAFTFSSTASTIFSFSVSPRIVWTILPISAWIRNSRPRWSAMVLKDRARSSNSSPLPISTRLSKSPPLMRRVPSFNTARGATLLRICTWAKRPAISTTREMDRKRAHVKRFAAANASDRGWLTTTIQLSDRKAGFR